MVLFSKVQDIVARLGLEASNRVLVDYWLSLWEGDALPPRAKFSPAKLKRFLPSIILFDVVPDARVTVRLVGTGYRYALGGNFTGKDWIAAAAEDHRAARLRVFSAVARGAIFVAHRRIAMLDSDAVVSEEVLLPFAPEPDGTVCVLVRVNFEGDQFQKIKSIPQVTGEPLDTKLVPFDAG